MNKEKKIIISFGTRPEIIKLAPIIHILKKRKYDFKLVHSGQHYSKNMNDVFLKKFKIKKIDYNLKLGKRNNSKKFINIFFTKFQKILFKEKPNILIVQGDTNTCLASALAANEINKKWESNIKIVHVEAGLRSYDSSMPEEINRIIVDHVSDLLLAPTKIQKNILLKEGIIKDIKVVGNTIADSLKNIRFKKLKKKFFLLTVHRFENVNKKKRLDKILRIMGKISQIYKTDTIFPCHPNTQKKIKKYNIKVNQRIKIIKPIDYDKFLVLLKNSKISFSDSGGLQEEACILKKHLITLRKNTERPETIKINSNFLSMLDENRVVRRVKDIFSKKVFWKKNPYGKNVSLKIINHIIRC